MGNACFCCGKPERDSLLPLLFKEKIPGTNAINLVKSLLSVFAGPTLSATKITGAPSCIVHHQSMFTRDRHGGGAQCGPVGWSRDTRERHKGGAHFSPVGLSLHSVKMFGQTDLAASLSDK